MVWDESCCVVEEWFQSLEAGQGSQGCTLDPNTTKTSLIIALVRLHSISVQFFLADISDCAARTLSPLPLLDNATLYFKIHRRRSPLVIA